MKKILLIALALLFVTCKKENTPLTPEITSEQVQYHVSHKSNTLQIQVSANVEFDVTSSVAWLRETSKTQVEKNLYTIEFAVDSNAATIQRLANLMLRQRRGDAQLAISVVQATATASAQDYSAYQHLFTDNLFRELKPNVPEDTLWAIQSESLREMALAMHRNTYPKEFRVQAFQPFPNPHTQASINRHSAWSLLDNPTGISVKPTNTFVVFVGPMQENDIILRVIDFSKGYSSSKDYTLRTGFNRLTIENEGLAYVMYHTDNTAAQPVDMHFISGEINGYFDAAKHTPSDWNRLINQAKDVHFDVIGYEAHLIFPTADFKQHAGDRGWRLIEIYDSIVLLQEQFTGLHKYNRENKNRMLFHVIYPVNEGGWLYATTYRTAYQQAALRQIANPETLRNENVWGPAHEVGHTLQIPTFRWVGMTEISVNMGSLHVRRTFSGTGGLTAYQQAINAIVKNDTMAHAAYTGSDHHSIRLVPFWQLELYFANAQGYKDFYADFYEKLREAPSSINDGQVQLNFVKNCCDLLELNLFDFFEAWGLLRPVDVEVSDYSVRRLIVTQTMIDEVKEHISKYPKPKHNNIWEITETNWANYR
jgi:hypothetical protein